MGRGGVVWDEMTTSHKSPGGGKGNWIWKGDKAYGLFFWVLHGSLRLILYRTQRYDRVFCCGALACLTDIQDLWFDAITRLLSRQVYILNLVGIGINWDEPYMTLYNSGQFGLFPSLLLNLSTLLSTWTEAAAEAKLTTCSPSSRFDISLVISLSQLINCSKQCKYYSLNVNEKQWKALRYKKKNCWR